MQEATLRQMNYRFIHGTFEITFMIGVFLEMKTYNSSKSFLHKFLLKDGCHSQGTDKPGQGSE